MSYRHNFLVSGRVKVKVTGVKYDGQNGHILSLSGP